VGSMYDYLTNPPTIRNIVVECEKGKKEKVHMTRRDRALVKLSNDRAVAEVRQALNRWYYDC